MVCGGHRNIKNLDTYCVFHIFWANFTLASAVSLVKGGLRSAIVNRNDVVVAREVGDLGRCEMRL